MTKRPDNHNDDDGIPKREKFDVEDPLSNLGSAATQLHELYVTFRNQGFEPSQAIYLLAAIISKSPGNPPSGGTDKKT